jgi:transcription initiation factor TFIID subunit 11
VQEEMMEAGEKQTDLPSPPSGETEGEAELKEPKRGPLRPEHLREAYRRHKLSGETRGVGVQHLWHAQQGDGVERFAVKTGKKMFR